MPYRWHSDREPTQERLSNKFGTIELGEYSQDTLAREFLEELGIEISIQRYLTCIENVYQIEHRIGHEITQIYLVEFQDKELYHKQYFKVVEGDRITHAKWIDVDDFKRGQKILYPND